MHIKFIHFSFVLLVLGLLWGCKSKPLIESELLQGKWLIEEAKRNRKVTKTLMGAWIAFEGNQMADNFISDEEFYDFQIIGNKISHQNITEQTYTIKKWAPDTLLLTSKIESHRFEFLLVKEKPIQ